MMASRLMIGDRTLGAVGNREGEATLGGVTDETETMMTRRGAVLMMQVTKTRSLNLEDSRAVAEIVIENVEIEEIATSDATETAEEAKGEEGTVAERWSWTRKRVSTLEQG